MKENQLVKNIIAGALTVTLSVLFAIPAMAETPQGLYDYVWRNVNAKYVDQTNNQQNWLRWRYKYDDVIKTDEDAYVAIETMLASLNDPYTRFLNPKEFAEETSSIQGSLKGIGIQIAVKDGKLMVIAPLEDTPAERAGIIADDEILEIDGASTKGITVDKAAEKIRGPEGTQVKLLIKRKDVAPKLYTVTRANIVVKSISSKTPFETQVPSNIEYIRISSFLSRNLVKEFTNVLADSMNKDGYIIDLRSNPGGLLTNAIDISDMFLSGGVIVSTIDRDGYKISQRAAKTVYTNKPLVVIINKGSASASEILSGALKDHGRAVIVGENSFGKGLVQEVNRLPLNSGMNITIQKYLTPNGSDIHKKGIKPDVEIEMTDDNIKNKDDVQLKKAIEVLNTMIRGGSVAIR
ncbi:S41 family peptidase [bacterium]|nr:S41 family peptidase [bacterium]